MRSLLLFSLRSLQYLLNFLLWAVVLVLFARFGLQFYPEVERGSHLLVVLLRSGTDPVISAVGSWFKLRWPSPALPIRLLPLAIAVPVWVVRVLIRNALERGRNAVSSWSPVFSPRGSRTAQRKAPEPESDDESEPLPITSDSWKAREQLLKRYREIEKALKSATRKSCTFLSVDVVGSTQMKTGESPTEIAASFQAYEEMLKKIFHKQKAWKQTWTPDGVLVCFLQREAAVGAGQRLLRVLREFNAKENRLRTPFRVRCGIHEGDVAIFDDSKLEAITDPVIDVAGHMQKYARENTLWLGESVYNALADKTGFRARIQMVDNLKVFEWSPEAPREEPAAATAASAAPSAKPPTPQAATPRPAAPAKTAIPLPAAPAPTITTPPISLPAAPSPAVPKAAIPLPAAPAPVVPPTPPPADRTIQASDAAASPVRRIGRYEILEELGRGAMGAVYKALDPQIGRTVALKVILTQGVSPEELRPQKERFYREARAAGKMMHPGIITIYDVGEDATGAPYLVMEFVEGKTLEKALSRGGGEPVSYSQRLTIAIELAEALDYAHHRGVVHRDIKPTNILLSNEGSAKIADFGIAKLVGAQSTIGLQALGTPAFVSPEQLTGAPVDARSDIFSLGVVMYWMFTGERPFTGETLTAITYKVVHEMPLPARQVNWAVPEELDQLLSRCLAKNPADRYQGASQLAADLQALREGKLPGGRPPT